MDLGGTLISRHTHMIRMRIICKLPNLNRQLDKTPRRTNMEPKKIVV